MYEKIQKLNPDIKIYRTSDKEFIPYGKVIKDVDSAPFIEAAKKAEKVENGSMYIPTFAPFEELKESKEIGIKYFGEMPTQMGYCYGYSNKLNAVEWHKSSEINVAVTPLILKTRQWVKSFSLISRILSAAPKNNGPLIS